MLERGSDQHGVNTQEAQRATKEGALLVAGGGEPWGLPLSWGLRVDQEPSRGSWGGGCVCDTLARGKSNQRLCVVPVLKICPFKRTQLLEKFWEVVLIQNAYMAGGSRTHLTPSWLRRYRICLQCRRPRFNPWVGNIPWRREWLPTPVFLPGEFHGQRNMKG